MYCLHCFKHISNNMKTREPNLYVQSQTYFQVKSPRARTCATVCFHLCDHNLGRSHVFKKTAVLPGNGRGKSLSQLIQISWYHPFCHRLKS